MNPAVAKRFYNMAALDRVAVGEVGDGARHTQHAVIAARGKFHSFRGFDENGLCCSRERRDLHEDVPVCI